MPAATVLAIVREAGGGLLADVRVFDLYHGEQVGEGRESLALALAFRAADRTLTDEDVGRCASASSPPCATSWGASCVPSVIVAGASGYTGALAAALLTATRASTCRRSPAGRTSARA